MERWIDDLARAWAKAADPGGCSAPDVARDVAHRVERKITPLSTFLLGVEVGRRQAAGDSRTEGLGAGLGASGRPAGGAGRSELSRGGTLDGHAVDHDPTPRRAAARRRLRAGRRRPARLGHRPVQLPLHVLHAGRGARVAAEGRAAHVRGARARGPPVRGPRRPVAQGHRRRGPASRRPAGPRAAAAAGGARRRHLDDDERRPARSSGRPSPPPDWTG